VVLSFSTGTTLPLLYLTLFATLISMLYALFIVSVSEVSYACVQCATSQRTHLEPAFQR